MSPRRNGTSISCQRQAASRSMGVRVDARDGAAIRNETQLKITALEDSELVLVDAA